MHETWKKRHATVYEQGRADDEVAVVGCEPGGYVGDIFRRSEFDELRPQQILARRSKHKAVFSNDVQ